MENSRKNEYIMIVVINFLLVLYTSIFLYGSPYALYNPFSAHTLLSILGWTLYAGSLYLILARSEKGTETRQQQIVTALRIGAGTAVLKAAIDVLTNYLLSYIVPSNIIGTAVKGIRNGALGFAFLYLLFRHFYKESGRTVKVSRKQKGAMAVLTVCYILALILIRVKVMLQLSALDSENMYAMYAYFMQGAAAGINEVNSINKWFFAVFMILWWQIMRTCYIEGD
ncbi:MAG: hypothetical protein NC429_14190 [Lachnospiraceae bacterium]|nr:hypothetical protein [Lachnospiraceae bacterium]